MSIAPRIALIFGFLTGCVHAPSPDLTDTTCKDLQTNLASEQAWTGWIAPTVLGVGLMSSSVSAHYGIRDKSIGGPHAWTSTPVLVGNAIVLGAGLYFYKRRWNAAEAEASIYRLNNPSAVECRRIYADFTEPF